MKYAGIAEQGNTFALAEMCDVLDVSISGYRAWKRGGKPDRQRLSDRQMLALIRLTASSLNSVVYACFGIFISCLPYVTQLYVTLGRRNFGGSSVGDQRRYDQLAHGQTLADYDLNPDRSQFAAEVSSCDSELRTARLS